MTRTGTAALVELTAGRPPKLAGPWYTRVQKAIRSGVDAPAGVAAATEADSEYDQAMKVTDVDKDILQSYRGKYPSLKNHPALSIRIEPSRNAAGEVIGNKGCGVYYSGGGPLHVHLGNYRTDGSKEISRPALEHLEKTQKHRYVLTLDSKGQRIVNADPEFANNWLALVNEPDDGACRCEETCKAESRSSGQCKTGTNAGETANVTIRSNGDFDYTGTQYKAGFLLAHYTRDTPEQHRAKKKQKTR